MEDKVSVLNVLVITSNPERAARAAEVLARAAAGLSMEGIKIMLQYSQDPASSWPDHAEPE